VETIDIEGDKLEAIFKRQNELIAKYHVIESDNGFVFPKEIPLNLDSPQAQLRLKEFAWRITEELAEAMSCLKNKPWKSTHMETDKSHYFEELADAFHFFVEMVILSGLDANGLTDIYFRKSEVNKFRQRSNY